MTGATDGYSIIVEISNYCTPLSNTRSTQNKWYQHVVNVLCMEHRNRNRKLFAYIDKTNIPLFKTRALRSGSNATLH